MTGPLIDFTKPRADNRKFLREITTWVEDRLPDSMDDVTVMVNEMQCFEPGCPPLETVVTLLAGQSIVFKIFKPVAEVVEGEIDPALQAALQGTAQQHVQQPAAAVTADFSISMECDEDD